MKSCLLTIITSADFYVTLSYFIRPLSKSHTLKIMFQNTYILPYINIFEFIEKRGYFYISAESQLDSKCLTISSGEKGYNIYNNKFYYHGKICSFYIGLIYRQRDLHFFWLIYSISIHEKGQMLTYKDTH